MGFSDSLNTEWKIKLTDNVTRPLKQLVGLEKESLDYFKRTTRSIDDMERELRNLERAAKNTFNTDRLKLYNREIEKLRTNIANANQTGLAGAGRSNAGRGGMGTAIMDALPGAGLLTNPYAIGAAGLTAAGAFANSAANSALDWDKRVAKINATAQLDPMQRQLLSNQLLSLGQQYTGENITDVADAYERIISQTNDASQAMTILKYSVTGAKAGFTDLVTTGTALTSILENTKKEGTQAAAVLDVLFKAKKVGAAEFEAFARYVPLQIAAAQGLGFDYRDIAGLYAFTTTKIPNADVANTLVENLFGQFKTPERVKQLQKMGISTTGANGQFRGLYNVLNDIKVGYDKALAQSPAAASNYLMNVTADRQAAQGLGVILNDFNKLKQTLNDVRDAAGETEKQLKYADYGASKIEEADKKWSEFKIKLGEKIAPVKIVLATELTNFLDGKGNLFNSTLGWTKMFTGGPDVAPLKTYNANDAKFTAQRFVDFGMNEGNTQAFLNKYGAIPGAAQAYNNAFGIAQRYLNAANATNQPGAAPGNPLTDNYDNKIPGMGNAPTDLGLGSSVTTEKTPRNFYQNIENLVREMNVSYTGAESKEEIKNIMVDLMVSAARDFSQGFSTGNN